MIFSYIYSLFFTDFFPSHFPAPPSVPPSLPNPLFSLLLLFFFSFHSFLFYRPLMHLLVTSFPSFYSSSLFSLLSISLPHHFFSLFTLPFTPFNAVLSSPTNSLTSFHHLLSPSRSSPLFHAFPLLSPSALHHYHLGACALKHQPRSGRNNSARSKRIASEELRREGRKQAKAGRVRGEDGCWGTLVASSGA